MPELTIYQWLIIGGCTVMIGMSKAGLKGITIVLIPPMAIIFGAKASTGIILPMFIMMDMFAVIHYNRHAQWKYLYQLLPPTLIGILLGVWLGKDMPEFAFKYLLATIILISVGLMFWWDRQKDKSVPDNKWFAIVMGLLVGFTTMVGNTGGAFATLFFLMMRMPKNNFIGTAAWLFFIVNWFKVPFHIFTWKTITLETFYFNLKLIPVLIIGFLLGVQLVKIIQEKYYRQLILWLTALGAFLIFFK